MSTSGVEFCCLVKVCSAHYIPLIYLSKWCFFHDETANTLLCKIKDCTMLTDFLNIRWGANNYRIQSLHGGFAYAILQKGIA
jgi:hypothetical protein